MRSSLPRVWSLLASLALHVLALSTAVTAPSSAHAGSTGAEAVDPWVGDAFEVEALVEREKSPLAAPAPLLPSPPAAPPPLVPPAPPEAPTPGGPGPLEPASQHDQHVAASSAAALGSAGADAGARANRPTPEPGVASAGEEGGGRASFGALGRDPSVRNLPKAFTRALPAAASVRDPAWLKLPAGAAGQAHVTLTLDESGHVSEVEFEHEEEVPHQLKNLVRRAVRLLGAGRFALSAASSESGREAFSLVASVKDGPPLGDEFADADHVLLREFEAPAPDRPGKAVFGYASGRRVEVRVELVTPAPGR